MTEKSSNPLQYLLSGALGLGPITPTHPAPPMDVPHEASYYLYSRTQVVTGLHQEQIMSHGTPPIQTSSSRSKHRIATPLEHSWEEKEFQFSSPAFLNFKFDPKPILACLPT